MNVFHARALKNVAFADFPHILGARVKQMFSVATVMCLMLSAPSTTIAPKEKTLPGVPRINREAELFTLRDTVASWYCTSRGRAAEAPCVVSYALAMLRSAKGKATESERDTVFMQALDMTTSRLNHQLAKMQYQKMFATFCTEARTHEKYQSVCENETLRSKYQLA